MLKVKFSQKIRRVLLALAALALASAASAWAVLFHDGRGPHEVWLEAQRELGQDHFDQAQANLERLSQLRSPTAEDWMLRAQLAIARNRFDEALKALSKIGDTETIAPQARLKAGQLEIRRNRARFAEVSLLAAIKLDPKMVQPHRELIYIYGMQLRRNELNAQFNAVSELAPLKFEMVWHWCLVRNAVWEPIENADILSRYLKADPDDRASRLALVECLRQIGRREECADLLKPLKDDDPEARVLRVNLALDRGDNETAETLLSTSSADSPALSQLRGQFALAQGDAATAVRLYRKVYEADPSNRDAVIGLSKALMAAGDEKAAAPLLAESKSFEALSTLMQSASLAKAKNDPVLYKQLGAACAAVHRMPEARAWYQLAIDLNQFDEAAQRAVSHLKALK